MRTKPLYETGFLRAAMALIAGAVAGTFLFIVPPLFFASGEMPTVDDLKVIPFLFLMWLIWIILFGLLPWLVLHMIGWRQWYVAVVLGAVMPVVFLLVLGNTDELAGYVPILSPVGMVVGWTIWRVAYRRVKVEGDA